MNEPNYLEYWFRALHEPVGIVLTSSDRHRLMNKLYAARREYEESSPLNDLSIVMSPTSDTELWILHKTVIVEEPDAQSKP